MFMRVWRISKKAVFLKDEKNYFSYTKKGVVFCCIVKD